MPFLTLKADMEAIMTAAAQGLLFGKLMAMPFGKLKVMPAIVSGRGQLKARRQICLATVPGDMTHPFL